jgi:hypothetical protein
LENLAVIPDQFSETPRWEDIMARSCQLFNF